jgi:hypothetical protein
MPLELNRMLEEELAKPEAEIDVELVDELLALLEESTPSEVEKTRTWQKISAELSKEQKRRPVWTRMRRVAIIMIGVIALFAISLSTAKALRWTFLLKLLEPLAQTFGIVTTDQLTESDSIKGEVSVEGDDTEQIVYDSFEAMPKTYKGHVVVPGWVPERYAFDHGTFFDNGWVEKHTVSYRYNDQSLSIDMTAYQEENTIVDFQYERAIDEPKTIDVEGIEALFYENSREGSIYAVWINDNVNYNLFGVVTREELIRIIGSMNKADEG